VALPNPLPSGFNSDLSCVQVGDWYYARRTPSADATAVSFRDFSQADLDGIAAELSGRPRQTLGFKTPSQALAEVLR
jgi:hypothetical protein